MAIQGWLPLALIIARHTHYQRMTEAYLTALHTATTAIRSGSIRQCRHVAGIDGKCYMLFVGNYFGKPQTDLRAR